MLFITQFLRIIFLLIILIVLCGCDKKISVSKVKNSPWVKEQLKSINTNNSGRLSLNTKELWVGKISSFEKSQKEDVYLQPSVCIKSRNSRLSKSYSKPIRLGFGKKDISGLKVGDTIVVVVLRGLKKQRFVKDWLKITDLPTIDPVFEDTYYYYLAIEIMRNMCFKYLNIVKPDGVKGLVISYGKKIPVKVHFKLPNGSWSEKASKKALAYENNSFELTLLNDGGKQSIKENLNPPEEIVQKGSYGRYSYTMKCGYGESSILFSELLFGAPAPEILPFTLRYSIFQESSGYIATHPTTYKHRNELAKAFKAAKIPGVWEIGDLGKMVLRYRTRKFSIQSKIFPKFSGPKPNGFIFIITPPLQEKPPLFTNKAIRFHYWNFKSGTIDVKPKDNDNKQYYMHWNFEYSDKCPPDQLSKILKVINKCEPLPEIQKFYSPKPAKIKLKSGSAYK